MKTYNYTFISNDIPPIPLIPIQLKEPDIFESKPAICEGILDTGSDCTLVPLPLLLQVKAKIGRNAVRIPVGGKIALGIPFEVGIIFDRYNYSRIQVFGCPVNEIGELLIIGRDLLNLHQIEFNGQNLTFTIF